MTNTDNVISNYLYYHGIYSGEWKNGKANGYGKCDWYEFQNNVLCTYVGNFVDSCMEGYGTQFLKNGVVYEGNWKNNKLNGKGKMYHVNGSFTFNGEFKNSKRNGYGVYYTGYKEKERIYYEGYYKYDKKHGYGK